MPFVATVAHASRSLLVGINFRPADGQRNACLLKPCSRSMPGKAEVKAKRRLLVQALRAIAVSCKVAAVRDDARRKKVEVNKATAPFGNGAPVQC